MNRYFSNFQKSRGEDPPPPPEKFEPSPPPPPPGIAAYECKSHGCNHGVRIIVIEGGVMRQCFITH